MVPFGASQMYDQNALHLWGALTSALKIVLIRLPHNVRNVSDFESEKSVGKLRSRAFQRFFCAVGKLTPRAFQRCNSRQNPIHSEKVMRQSNQHEFQSRRICAPHKCPLS